MVDWMDDEDAEDDITYNEVYKAMLHDLSKGMTLEDRVAELYTICVDLEDDGQEVIPIGRMIMLLEIALTAEL